MKKQDKLSVISSTTVTTKSDTLTTEEEQVLRMRAGISLKPTDRLESKLDNINPDVRAEVAARLALIQSELLKAREDDSAVDYHKRARIIDALITTSLED